MAKSLSDSGLISLLPLLLCCFLDLASCDLAQDRAECQESLVGLATCLTYVQGKGKAPTPDCCDGLGDVLAKNRKCLCVLIKDRNEPTLGFKFNATLAMQLPDVCHKASNISECPTLLGLSPNSPAAQIFEQFGSRANSSSVHGLRPESVCATAGTESSPGAATASGGKDSNAGNGGGSSGLNKWLTVGSPLIAVIANLALGG